MSRKHANVERTRAVFMRSPIADERAHKNGTYSQAIMRRLHMEYVPPRLKIRNCEVIHCSEVRVELEGKVYTQVCFCTEERK